MAHGAPDASNVVKQRRVYSLSDDAELAVRMGGPHSIDRLGDVLWQETYERTLGGWAIFCDDPGNFVIRTPFVAITDGYSMMARATGGATTETFFEHRWAWEYTGFLGMEMWLSDCYYAARFLCHWWAGNAGGTALYAWRYEGATGDIEYQDAAHAWHTLVPGAPGLAAPDRFVPVKVLIDPIAEEWVAFSWQGHWYDMQGIAAQWAGAPAPWAQDVQLSISNIPGYDADVYMDNIIMTQNEITPFLD